MQWPYSPFFTSGLLFEPILARRGSVPDTSASPKDDLDAASSFYFTMQPPRDNVEFRSFLSLDLAESQSLRSHSLRRKQSRPISSVFATQQQRPTLPPPPPSKFLGPRRPSRDSLRTMPSPKPAPSATLPALPTPPQTTLSPTPHTPLPTPPHTAPVTYNRRASRSTPVYPRARPVSGVTRTTSTASTRYRTTRRADALARLEGRFQPYVFPTPAPTPRNFMSMSDDEDDNADDADESASDSDSDVSSRTSASSHDSWLASPAQHTSFLPPLTPSSPISLEPEDRVLPVPSSTPALRLDTTPKAPRVVKRKPPPRASYPLSVTLSTSLPSSPLSPSTLTSPFSLFSPTFASRPTSPHRRPGPPLVSFIDLSTERPRADPWRAVVPVRVSS